MLHRAAPLLLVLAGCPCSSSEPVGDALEPGIHYGASASGPALTPGEMGARWMDAHPGPCGNACYDAWTGTCAWRDTCEADPSASVDCAWTAGHTLTCGEAEAAGSGLTGLSSCWRDCEQLRTSTHLLAASD